MPGYRAPPPLKLEAPIPGTREHAQAKADHWREKMLSHEREAKRQQHLAEQALIRCREWEKKKEEISTDEELYARVVKRWEEQKKREEEQKKKAAPTNDEPLDPNKQWVEVEEEEEEGRYLKLQSRTDGVTAGPVGALRCAWPGVSSMY